MSYQEHALTFQCEGETLVGILAVPEDSPGHKLKPMTDTAVVMIVGGPQYRAGSHRQYTLLARALAGAGHPVLRFDYRGMGDSGGPKRDFESVSADIAAAIGATQQRIPGLRKVILCGLCDGASAALLYLNEAGDPRVTGLCLFNPWVRSEASLARTHVRHYYLQRLVQREFWMKLARGGVAAKALSELYRSLGQLRAPRPGADGGGPATHPAFQRRMASAAAAFPGDIILVMSGVDFTAREFAEHARSDPLWKPRLGSASTTWLDIDGADHTFSGPGEQQALQGRVIGWLGSLARAA